MSMQFGGVGSGLPVNEWIDQLMKIEQASVNKLYNRKSQIQVSKTSLSTVESKFSSLRSSIEKLTDAHLASSFDLFEKKKATSSDEDIATATASTGAAVQQIELKVESLATATRAKSLTGVAESIKGTDVFTELNDGNAEEGTFSFYVDGQREEFEITETDTLTDIVNTINSRFTSSEVVASVDEITGKFKIEIDNNQLTSFQVGASSDTSNFLNVMQLSTAQESAPDGFNISTLESTSEISAVNTQGTILGDANIVSGITDGSTFKIGNAEFTIDSNTTFAGLLSEINNNEDAGVIAQYDMKSNKISLISKDAGKTAITLEDTSGNFLSSVGLISGTDSLAAQTLGNNAKIYLNGAAEAIEANSNTITSDISGISNVTINLKQITEVGETITIDVEQDTDSLVSAVEDFVKKFNDSIKEIDKKTGVGKDLSSEYSLVSLRNSVRMLATDNVDGLETYDSFAMVGITTGAVGKSVDEDTKALVFDKEKFLEALQNNPNEVKTLLIGDPDAGITGVLKELELKAESALDPINGYFSAREDSMNSMITDLDKSILHQEERMEKKREQLVRQFAQMDQYISKMQQQGNALAML